MLEADEPRWVRRSSCGPAEEANSNRRPTDCFPVAMHKRFCQAI